MSEMTTENEGQCWVGSVNGQMVPTSESFRERVRNPWVEDDATPPTLRTDRLIAPEWQEALERLAQQWMAVGPVMDRLASMLASDLWPSLAQRAHRSNVPNIERSVVDQSSTGKGDPFAGLLGRIDDVLED